MSVALVFVWAPPVRAWPAGHRTLQCGDCHGAAPGARTDCEEVTTGPLGTDVCWRCHEPLRHRGRVETSAVLGHPCEGYVPAAMHDHFREWLRRNRELFEPPLTEDDLPMAPREGGYGFDCLTCHPSQRDSSGYSRIGLFRLELCVACHGGECPPSESGLPRLLLNPMHLGTADRGREYPAPVGVPPDGSAVAGTVYLPLVVFDRLHTNPRTGLGYVVEVDLGMDDRVDLQEFVVETTPGRPPMRWQTGNPPRWPGESELHRLSAGLWPAGTHEVRLVPLNKVESRYGVAQRVRLRRAEEDIVSEPMATGLSCGGVFWSRLLRRWEDDRGHVLRLYCIDGGRAAVEFQLFFGTRGAKGRRVGRCSAVGGANFDLVAHTGDQDGNGRPDAFVGTLWRSQREVALSPGEETVEWSSYEYDATADRLVLKRFHSRDGPGGAYPDLLREEAEDLDPVDFDWVLGPTAAP